MNWQRVPNRNRIRNIRKKIRVSSGKWLNQYGTVGGTRVVRERRSNPDKMFWKVTKRVNNSVQKTELLTLFVTFQNILSGLDRLSRTTRVPPTVPYWFNHLPDDLFRAS